MAVNVDLASAAAFGLAEVHVDLCAPMHAHSRHQLLFAVSGAMRFTTPRATYLLPPQRAAWIPAGMPHSAQSRGPVALRTLYFQPAFGPAPAHEVVVFGVTPLCRELLDLATRWGPDSTTTGLAAHVMSAALGLAHEWVNGALPCALPRARSETLARAMSWALANPAVATLPGAAAHVGVSPRTLARRFEAETGAGWRSFFTAARMTLAMEWLADPERPVTHVALDLGYESPAAFSHAFGRFAGCSPSAWRAAS